MRLRTMTIGTGLSSTTLLPRSSKAAAPIVLTERKDHLDYLAEMLRGFVRHLVILKGGTTAKERRQNLDQLASIPDTAERLVLATGRYVGEGFDDARLDTLFLAMPVSWKGTLVQYTGRLYHRRHPGKTQVRIYDYVDREIPMLLRMFEKRLSAYRAIGDMRAGRHRWASENSRRRPSNTMRRQSVISTKRCKFADLERAS